MSLGESSSGIGRVVGLGAAGEGGDHWIHERVTSIALVLLGTWLLASLLFLPSLDRAILAEWLGSAWGAIPMALFVITAFIHGLDGMKVVVGDYVHDEGSRFVVNTLLLFLAIGGASIALFALARIAFGGAS